eukprot:scaffold163136_cov32-Tisochrysis_lutea.AAC.6
MDPAGSKAAGADEVEHIDPRLSSTLSELQVDWGGRKDSLGFSASYGGGAAGKDLELPASCGGGAPGEAWTRARVAEKGTSAGASAGDGPSAGAAVSVGCDGNCDDAHAPFGDDRAACLDTSSSMLISSSIVDED